MNWKYWSGKIFQIPPLRQPKDSGNAKMLVACLRVVSLRCQFFSDIFTKQPHPPARVNLWVGGWFAGSCWIVLKTAVKRDAVLCGATCRKIFVFPTYESVACSITTQLLTLTWWEFLVWNWREVKKMTYTYNRKGITRKVLSEIVRGLGAKDELKILKWQIIFQIPPCVNRKIVATRKCSWHVCASCHYDVSSFPTYLQSNRTPLPA